MTKVLYYVVMAHYKFISKPVYISLIANNAEEYINNVKKYNHSTIYTISEVWGDVY